MTTLTDERLRGHVRPARLAYALEWVMRAGVLLVLVTAVIRPLASAPMLGFGTGPYWAGMTTVSVALDETAFSSGEVVVPELPGVMGRGEFPRGDALEMVPRLEATIVVNNPDFRQSVVLVWVPLLNGLSLIAVMVLTIRILRTVRRGDVFVADNVRRLYAIAAIVVVGGCVLQALSLWGYWGVVGNLRVAQYVQPTWEISWVPLVAGLAVAVAAEVFRQGIRLRDDAQGTV